MDQVDKTRIREMKLANGEIVKLTEEEFGRVVDVFRLLLDADRSLLLEATNGSKLNLIPLRQGEVRKKSWQEGIRRRTGQGMRSKAGLGLLLQAGEGESGVLRYQQKTGKNSELRWPLT